MNTIQLVPIEYIHQALQKCGNYIENAMLHAKGECTYDQLKAQMVNGTQQLLLFLEDKEIVGAVVFHFSNAPNARIFYINAIGGKTTKEHTDLMFQFAKAQGATCVRGCARESVARLWRQKYGFDSIYITVEKQL